MHSSRVPLLRLLPLHTGNAMADMMDWIQNSKPTRRWNYLWLSTLFQNDAVFIWIFPSMPSDFVTQISLNLFSLPVSMHIIYICARTEASVSMKLINTQSIIIKAWCFSDLIWRDSSGSVLVLVVACWLTVPRHYPKQDRLSSVNTHLQMYILKATSGRCITVTFWWARWRLKSLASRLFSQKFVQAQAKKKVKAPRHWRFWRELTGDRWIPRIKGQWRDNVSLWRHHPYTILHDQAIWKLSKL